MKRLLGAMNDVMWFGAAGLFSLGFFSLQQAAFFDGDDRAHARSVPFFHQPKHPFAKRAWSRGLRLTLMGIALSVGLLLTR